jgi:ABC-type multidrug transport system fused ATPase/permease subunit
MFAVKAGQCGELIENSPTLTAATPPVSFTRCSNQFVPRRHAYLPHSELRWPMPAGSISDEATARYRGTDQARQCGLVLIVARQTVDGIDLAVPPAQMVGIIGRSGASKSTCCA